MLPYLLSPSLLLFAADDVLALYTYFPRPPSLSNHPHRQGVTCRGRDHARRGGPREWKARRRLWWDNAVVGGGGGRVGGGTPRLFHKRKQTVWRCIRLTRSLCAGEKACGVIDCCHNPGLGCIDPGLASLEDTRSGVSILGLAGNRAPTSQMVFTRMA